MPKIRRISCLCNYFFVFVAIAVGFAAVSEVNCQPGISITPFLNSSTGLTSPVECLFNGNPAGISRVASSAVSAAFSPSPFGVAELGFADAMLVRRFSDEWVAGVSASGFSTPLFNEFHGALLSAASEGENFTIGAAGEFSRIQVRSYEAQSQFQVHLGAFFRIDSSVVVAASLGNVLRSAFGASDKISQLAQFGIGVAASDDWTFDADVRITEKASLEVAAKYAPVSGLKIRLAYSTERQAVEVFPAVQASSAEIFSRLQWSNYLGFSQQIGIVWAW